ncbi:MAG: FAD:protein FMN transferase [Cytophagaceae bacterium]|nr:FAD:protein FMN transferase [Cytophagaceae bacterium]MBL0325543.1 FAD:protein FMN transferase [Cytophagaceae bacterium]
MRNFLILVLLGVSLFGCKPTGEYVGLSGQAQGTSFAITFEAIDDADYSAEVDSLFRFIDKSMSLWDSTSLISKINRNDFSEPIDSHFKNVLEASLRVEKETEGYFNVTVGPLVKAWGFVTKKNMPAPSDAQVDSLKALIGKVGIDSNGKFFKDKPNLQIDFNAIAQGYTVDVIARFLESKGIKNYLVEIGGEVYGKGKNREGKFWKVGIEKPEEDRQGIASVVNLKNRALATSGSYRKFFIKDGKKFSHAVDPHTGYPVQHNLLSISVLADNCTDADAYATALLVMGLEKAQKFAEAKGIDFFAIYDQNGKNKYYSTSGFKKVIEE